MNRNATTANTQNTEHTAFLSILPAIEAHARVAFRLIRCPHDRADAAALDEQRAVLDRRAAVAENQPRALVEEDAG